MIGFRMAGKRPPRTKRLATDTVVLTREVRAADLDRRKLTLRLDDGNTVSVPFRKKQEAAITNAVRDHLGTRLCVRVRGELAGKTRRLKRIVGLEGVTTQSEGTTATVAARPIWEIIDDIMKDLPEDVLRRLPRDGAEQHDHYIYGTPKRRP